MDIEKEILDEAHALDDYMMEVPPTFLPQEEIDNIDLDEDGWEDRVREKLTQIERDWFDMVEEIQDLILFFLAKYDL